MSRIKIERNISYDTIRKKFYVYLDGGQDQDGNRIRSYKTFPSLPLARQTLRTFQTKKASDYQVTPTNITLIQWLEYWMREIIVPNRADTTIYGYQKIIDNHLAMALGSIPIQKLTPRDLQEYYSMLMTDKGLAANTVRRHHDLLSCALRMALKQDMLVRSPTERVEPPRVIQKEARFYTSEHLKTLYHLIQGHWLEPIVHLAGSLGMRREEICGLHWKSVDFENRKLHIKSARTAAGANIFLKETKNRSSNRVLHLTNDTYHILWKEKQKQEARMKSMGDRWPNTDLMAVDANGMPYSPNIVSLSFSRFIRKHNLPPITLHGLRHTFATVASAQGAPLFDIGKALGHSTPATTGRIYTHLVDHTHASTLDLVAAALKM